jgi:Tol biopolymer transport system component
LNPDPRWSAEIASDIVIYDLNRQQIRQITEQGKFFSPAIAPNAKTLAAVRFTPERKCNLVLLETNSGKVVQILPNPDNGYIKNPAWSPDGRQLVYFKQTLYAKSLAVYDLESATETIITPECHAFDEYPVFYDQYILYNSAWSGIDNIYAVDTTDGRRFQVTSRRYGAYYPAVAQDQTRLLFAIMTSMVWMFAKCAGISRMAAA